MVLSLLVTAPSTEPTEQQNPADPPGQDAWPHQTIEFQGDTLHVRKPTPQALAAFSLATSKFVSDQMRNNMTGMFIQRHLSPDSYERVFSRLMDPDDTDYTIETIGQLMRAVVMMDGDAEG